MQLTRNDSSRRGTLAQVSAPTPTPKAAQTAGKWVGMAVDPRGSIKVLGRASAFLGTLALQTRGAAAFTCYQQDDFKSPSSGNAYAIRAACNEEKDYFHRLVNNCHAVIADAGNPLSWHQIAHWGNTQLFRQAAQAPGYDAGFEACLISQAHTQSKHLGMIAGIVVGSVVGATLVGTAVVLGVRHCCRGHQAPADAPDVEMALPPTLPVSN